MSVNKFMVTKDSIKFLLTLLKQKIMLPQKNLFTSSQEGDFYKTEYRNSDLVVVFHGMNHFGNKDIRILKLVQALMNIGFDCLVPQITAYKEIRSCTLDDFEKVAVFINENIQDREQIFFIGPSTSCLYIAKLVSMPLLKSRVKSALLISPYFSAEKSFREVLEYPRNFYGQLVMLKILLYTQSLEEKTCSLTKELNILDKAIDLCFAQRNQIDEKKNVVQFLKNESKTTSLLLHLIHRLGSPNIISKELEPSFINLSRNCDYLDDISTSHSEIVIMHSLTDTIFPPKNGINLSRFLQKSEVPNYLLVTGLLDHADIQIKNIFSELFGIIHLLNHFFSMRH